MKRKILSIILIILIVILSGNVSFASREGELQQGIEEQRRRNRTNKNREKCCITRNTRFNFKNKSI